ncbi:MAG: malonate decarboxylase subunit alpha [Eubacteriales bacterium]|nr:malonate decarboxylase subunit alpha [Eubacteriales bacterium]MDD3611745.1 malonate decarboxylase subunit alpha [Eubacteriales bacterium]
MNWHKKCDLKQARLRGASPYLNQKQIKSESIVDALEALMRPGDRVVIEGDNQKQATFLAQALTKVNSDIVNDVTMIVPSHTRHLFCCGRSGRSGWKFIYGLQHGRHTDFG